MEGLIFMVEQCHIEYNKKRNANKKYNASRSFIFVENDLVNLKIGNTKKTY